MPSVAAGEIRGIEEASGRLGSSIVTDASGVERVSTPEEQEELDGRIVDLCIVYNMGPVKAASAISRDTLEGGAGFAISATEVRRRKIELESAFIASEAALDRADVAVKKHRHKRRAESVFANAMDFGDFKTAIEAVKVGASIDGLSTVNVRVDRHIMQMSDKEIQLAIGKNMSVPVIEAIVTSLDPGKIDVVFTAMSNAQKSRMLALLTGQIAPSSYQDGMVGTTIFETGVAIIGDDL